MSYDDRFSQGPGNRRWYQRCAWCSFEELEHHPACMWAKMLRVARRTPFGIVVVLSGRDWTRYRGA